MRLHASFKVKSLKVKVTKKFYNSTSRVVLFLAQNIEITKFFYKNCFI